MISFNRAYIEYSRRKKCHSFFFISISKLTVILRTLDPPHFYCGCRHFRAFKILLSCDLNLFPVSPSAFLFCHICGPANSTWTSITNQWHVTNSAWPQIDPDHSHIMMAFPQHDATPTSWCNSHTCQSRKPLAHIALSPITPYEFLISILMSLCVHAHLNSHTYTNTHSTGQITVTPDSENIRLVIGDGNNFRRACGYTGTRWGYLICGDRNPNFVLFQFWFLLDFYFFKRFSWCS